MNRAVIIGALTAGLLVATATAASAAAWTIYGDVSAPRSCTAAERESLGAYPGERCEVTPRLDQGQFDEGDPAWCWPDEDSPSWVQRARKELC